MLERETATTPSNVVDLKRQLDEAWTEIHRLRESRDNHRATARAYALAHESAETEVRQLSLRLVNEQRAAQEAREEVTQLREKLATVQGSRAATLEELFEADKIIVELHEQLDEAAMGVVCLRAAITNIHAMVLDTDLSDSTKMRIGLSRLREYIEGTTIESKQGGM